MKIPEIEGVVDHLVKRGGIELMDADLGLNHKDDSSRGQHQIGTLAISRKSKWGALSSGQS